MNHTNKIILVSHEQREPLEKIMANLDRQMKHISENKVLPADVKMARYNRLLQLYQSKMKIKQKPYELEIREPESLISDETILENIPKTQQKHAKNLLDFVRRNPLIEILKDGKVKINGELLRNTDIVTLIHDFSRGTKGEPVEGAAEFASALKQLNIPLTLVGNKHRHELFAEPLPDFPWFESL